MRRRTRRALRVAAWTMFRGLEGRYLWDNFPGEPNPEGAQCVNLANRWLQRLGIPSIDGDAAEFLFQRREYLRSIPSYMRPDLHAGDVAVFPGMDDAPRGHVCVVLDGSKEPFESMDLNYPENSPVRLREHPRGMTSGIMRPI